MAPSEETPAADDQPVSATSPSVLTGVTDRLSVRQYLTKLTVNEAAYTRLHSELEAAIPEFELVVERAGAEGASWVESGRTQLSKAEMALRRGAIEEAWRHLHTARRLEIYGLERIDEQREEGEGRATLDIRAGVVREEALETLDGWRRRAFVTLLGDEDESPRTGITGSELRAATRILQEHYEGIFLVRSERQRQFNQLALMGLLSGLALFSLTVADRLWAGNGGLTGFVAGFIETPFGAAVTITEPGFALFVSIVGVMGASLFGMRSLRKQTLPTKIPQQINQLTVTGARGIIGAISALLFYFVLQTPLLTGGSVLAEGAITAPMMIVVGFAAGYTERMAPSVVATVASITDSDTDDESNVKPERNR